MILRLRLFQAELCLCLCDDPQDCWQAVLAAKAACEINLKFGKNASAREYCVKYCEMVRQAPWSADPRNIQYMRELLGRLE